MARLFDVRLSSFPLAPELMGSNRLRKRMEISRSRFGQVTLPTTTTGDQAASSRVVREEGGMQ